MKRKITLTILSFVFAAMIGLASASFANAASDDATSDVTFDIISAIEVTATTATYDFSDVSPASSPVTQTDAATINVKSNSSWSLDAQANSANFTGGANDKPFSDLEVYDEDLTTWNALSNAETKPVQDGSQTTNSGDDVAVDYRLTVDWDDDTGSYSGTITYTGTTS